MCPSTLSGSSSSEVSNIGNRSHSPGGASDTVVVASLGGVDLGDAAAIDLRADATAAAAAVVLRADATAAAAVDLRGAPLGLLRGVCVGVRVLGWVPVGGVRAVCALKVNSCSISFNPISSAMVLTHVMTMARLACRACVLVCFALFVIFVSSSCLLLYFFVICAAAFLYGISILWNQLLTESNKQNLSAAGTCTQACLASTRSKYRLICWLSQS